MERFTHEALEDLVTLARTLHAHQADQHAWRTADALERREHAAVQLLVDARRGTQHPIFFGLRQHPDVERSAHGRHFIEIGVGERCTVPGFHLDWHAVELPMSSYEVSIVPEKRRFRKGGG